MNEINLFGQFVAELENNCGITSQPHLHSVLKAITASAVSQTPINPTQQHLDQHALMKQVSLLNK